MLEERLQFGTNKWSKGLFEEHSEDVDGDQTIFDQRWRPDAPAKWDMIASGKWIQKVVLNRWGTTREQEEPNKTPVTSTWTEDFLTREGDGRKSVGD